MAHRQLDPGWTTVVVTAIFNILVSLFCRSAQDAIGHHWLHGIEHKELPGVLIVWGVGLIFFLSGRYKDHASEYLGYLFLIFSSVYAGRLCFFA